MSSKSIPERPSLLSSASGYENYRGFLNLLYVILAIGGFRLVLENILKYGLLVEFDWPIRFLQDPTHWPSVKNPTGSNVFIFILSLSFQVFLVVLINLFVLLQFSFELKLNPVGKKVSSRENHFWTACQVINLSCILIFPAVYIYHRKPNPAGAFIAVCLYSIIFLKLVSYSHVNAHCRADLKAKKHDHHATKSSNEHSQINYPENLNLENLFYFIFAPTLCYELNFPRSPRIRKRFICRRFAEILIISSLQYCLSQQWILPILRTLDRPLNQYSALENMERLLRLALPNHLIWLLLFYVYFHSTLNLIAELLRFGDRLFYRDWWNATDLYEFWNRWNTIVHDFCKRHIYHPLVQQCGFNKLIGSLVVFAVSAFFHEVTSFHWNFCSTSTRHLFSSVFNQRSTSNDSPVEFFGDYGSSADRLRCQTNKERKQDLWKYSCVVLINSNSTYCNSSLYSRSFL